MQVGGWGLDQVLGVRGRPLRLLTAAEPSSPYNSCFPKLSHLFLLFLFLFLVIEQYDLRRAMWG